MSSYNNSRALKALTRASLQSILKSPSAVVFSIAFPLVFIIAFGFLGGSKGFSVKVAKAPGCDTSNALYAALHENPSIKWVDVQGEAATQKALKDASIVAVIDIQHQKMLKPAFKIELSGAESQLDKLGQLRAIINETAQSLNPELAQKLADNAGVTITASKMREFKTIDFILPGQLGFSLLEGSIFGTAFIFFNMRQTLVLKRFFATPVRREIIVLSEGIARMLFQIITAIVIIGVGYFAFDYHLINGWATVLQMVFLCTLGVMVFMGFGFSVSGIAKSESSIPPLANIITMPQFLLAGTFFPISDFPAWLQPLCRLMPLTYLNDALRKTAFDGASLWDVRIDILVLLVWGVLVYLLASKVFKWE
ncbi:MAG: ABC transporter permease [Chitinophagaceae bacterium]|nr:ABC transporter permease [Chitinophagaceae bacterium]